MAKGKGGFLGHDGLNAPDSPTGVSASGGNTQATISFTAPSDVGGSAITGYRAQSNDGIGASGSSSPITVTGLTNGTSYTFNVWAINAFGYSAPSNTTGSVTPENPLTGDIGLVTRTQRSTSVDYVRLASTGNAYDWGDTASERIASAGVASSTRGVFGGNSASTANMEYLTILTAGTTSTFGDLTDGRGYLAGASNSTRGLFAGGTSSTVNTIDYITIASTSNAIDFGDLTQSRYSVGGSANSTRALFFGGDDGGAAPAAFDIIDYVTIASTGNASDFGDLTTYLERVAGASSTTRCCMAGGSISGTTTNVIQYVTIASTGNASDFGDLTVSRDYAAGLSNTTRAVFAGGSGNNTIDYVTIASTGNATDLGDLTAGNYYHAGLSNAHGGLS